MLSRKTVFVVGAGASEEVGLPIGDQLAAEIASLVYFEFDFGSLKGGNPDFLTQLQRMFRDNQVLNDHLQVGRLISQGIQNAASIDNFIDIHRDDPKVATLGKAAIAYALLAKERTCKLHLRDNRGRRYMEFSELTKTWYPKFGRMLRDGVGVPELGRLFDNLTIICFNYDRCIEHFLAHWVESIYGAGTWTTDLAGKLKILRPYGFIGPLTGRDGVEFGLDLRHSQLTPIIGRLKTYTEQITDQAMLNEVRDAMATARRIVFLGFGFHKQNMDVLTPKGGVAADEVLGTATRISKSDLAVITNDIANRFKTQNGYRAVDLRNDLNCSSFFDEFSRTLQL